MKKQPEIDSVRRTRFFDFQLSCAHCFKIMFEAYYPVQVDKNNRLKEYEIDTIFNRPEFLSTKSCWHCGSTDFSRKFKWQFEESWHTKLNYYNKMETKSDNPTKFHCRYEVFDRCSKQCDICTQEQERSDQWKKKSTIKGFVESVDWRSVLALIMLFFAVTAVYIFFNPGDFFTQISIATLVMVLFIGLPLLSIFWDIVKISFFFHHFTKNDEIPNDTVLLNFYVTGWNDCAAGRKNKHFSHPMLKRAYVIGWCDFKAGDDVSSVDEKSTEEILKQIKQ